MEFPAAPTPETNTPAACDGQSLKRIMQAAGQWLRGHAAAVNALNVFPVPDGDTGTNMSLTMATALTEIERLPEKSASVIAQSLAHGALMGARGNSGVILSQILRGFARSLDGKDTFSARDLIGAAEEAYITARRGVIKPVEGTILTVMGDTANAIRTSIEHTDDIAVIMAEAVEAAKKSTAETPEKLHVLKEAGVVDAGGQGLVYLLEGALRCLRGENTAIDADMEVAVDLKSNLDISPDGYGYDVQFLIHGEALDVDEIRQAMDSMGDSLLIVGDTNMVKVHIHAHDPGIPIGYGASKGTLADVAVENMQEQYQRFVMGQARPTTEDITDIAIVCVASGEGLIRIIQSMGTSKIIQGGQTMNPSIQEILAAVEGVRADKVLLLPNNANVIPAARQASSLSSKQVVVVPTRSIPQGIAALFGFNYQAGIESNAERMMRNAAEIQTIEITHAVRSTQVNGVKVSHGDVIGLLNDKLVATGQDDSAVTLGVLKQASADEHEIAAVYFGQDVTEQEASALADQIRHAYAGLEIEVHDGGQPYYRYIISLE
jgi:DAK2 domain fusion protein YloV